MSVDSAIQHYPEDWTLTTLGEICKEGGGEIQTGPFGSQLHAADYVIDGIPSIMPKNISVEGISTNDIARITEEDALRLSKYRVTTGDIVYSRRGDVEKCALVSAIEDSWLCGTGCLLVRLGDNALVSPVFLHAYLYHPEVKEWICRHAVGATMPNLNTSILKALPVLIPSPEEMEFVEKLWTSMIGKVVLNRQTNQTLEQIAQAIFKSWFVDFEPVKAKQHVRALGGNDAQTERAAQAVIAGALNLDVITIATDLNALDQQLNEALSKKLAHQTKAQREQLAITAKHFPDQLVESALGLIPEGWNIVPFTNFAKLDTTSVKPFDKPETVWEHYSIPAFDKGMRPSFDLGEDIKSNKYRVDPNAVLCSKLNPQFPRTWCPMIETEEAVICSTEFMQFVPLNPAHRAWVLGVVTSNPFQEGILQRVTGSTGSRQRAQPKSVAAMGVINSGADLIESYSILTGPIYESRAGNLANSGTLAFVRDALLPNLLSGKIGLNTPGSQKESNT